jgi:ribonuclease HI
MIDLKVYTDAATKGPGGPSGGGVLIVDKNQEQLHFPLQETSNHLAEMAAILYALSYLIEKGQTEKNIWLYSDSKTAIQLFDKGQTSNRDFRPYLQQFELLSSQFQLLILQWIPESQNKGADNLARQGLQLAKK